MYRRACLQLPYLGPLPLCNSIQMPLLLHLYPPGSQMQAVDRHKWMWILHLSEVLFTNQASQVAHLGVAAMFKVCLQLLHGVTVRGKP